VEFAGAVTDEIVGAVRSILIGVVVSEFAAGPLEEVTVPKTEFAKTCGTRVPSLQLLTVNVKVLPEDALIANEQPVAVPEFVKSAFETELTFCEKVSE
jgi:hypothetical protein